MNKKPEQKKEYCKCCELKHNLPPPESGGYVLTCKNCFENKCQPLSVAKEESTNYQPISNKLVEARQGEEEWDREFKKLINADIGTANIFIPTILIDWISSHKSQWEQQARAERDEELRRGFKNKEIFRQNEWINKNESSIYHLAIKDCLSLLEPGEEKEV